MAIAIIGSQTPSLASAASLTFTHALGTARATNNTRCVVVFISNYSSASGATNTPVSGVTYNSVAMTLGPQINSGTGSSAHSCIAYILDASLPSTTGNYSVVVTTAGSNRIYGVALELTGVDQTAGLTVQGTLAQPNGSVTNPITLAVTTPNANDFILNTCSAGGNDFTAVPSGTAGQATYENANDGSAYNIFTSTLQAGVAGSYTTGWSESGGTPSRQTMVVAALKTYITPSGSTLDFNFWASNF